VLVGDLLLREVPQLVEGDLQIVSIARYPGELTKVLVRRGPSARGEVGQPVRLVVGVGGDHVRRVRERLGGHERIEIIQWHRDPELLIAGALGLSSIPPMQLQPVARIADVLLGEIDVAGVAGRARLNLRLAAVLIGWRIHLRHIARSAAWLKLVAARREEKPVNGRAVSRVAKGVRISVYGLSALLPIGLTRGIARTTPPDRVTALLDARVGRDLRLRVVRLDEETGRITVSDRVAAARQLHLPLEGPEL
jgi:transcription antitermination factor NusA-like protein